MITVGQFYMHDKALDVCVLVVADHGSFTYEVQWWNIGYTGNPWRVDVHTYRIYMHPDVWTNITDKLQIPRYENA